MLNTKSMLISYIFPPFGRATTLLIHSAQSTWFTHWTVFSVFAQLCHHLHNHTASLRTLAFIIIPAHSLRVHFLSPPFKFSVPHNSGFVLCVLPVLLPLEIISTPQISTIILTPILIMPISGYLCLACYPQIIHTCEYLLQGHKAVLSFPVSPQPLPSVIVVSLPTPPPPPLTSSLLTSCPGSCVSVSFPAPS